MMKRKNIKKHKGNLVHLFIAIALCELAGIIGSAFTVSSIPTWYAGLTKPWFNPPNWIFAPVWTTLYALMGIAVYLVWQKGVEKSSVRWAVTLFGVHLVYNAAWSVIFFGLQNLGAAFAEIVVLWCLIVAVVGAFFSIDKRASYLLIPYIAWVTFAAVLNLSLWILNG